MMNTKSLQPLSTLHTDFTTYQPTWLGESLRASAIKNRGTTGST